MRAAAIQLNSTADKARNLEVADRLARAAAADGRRARRPARRSGTCSAAPDELERGAEELDVGAIDQPPRGLGARARHPRLSPAASPSASRAPSGSSTPRALIDRRRRDRRRLPQDPHVRRRRRRGRATASPRTSSRARRSSAADVAGVELGLTICYDLRFPELYRILAVRGARVLTVPSAFTRDDRTRPLGGAAAGAGDREPGLRDRRRTSTARRRRTTAPTGTR